MSRKYNCYDNAPMKSLWDKLKMKRLNDYKFKTRDEVKRAVFDYIQLFNNRHRIHSTNGYVPVFKFREPA